MARARRPRGLSANYADEQERLQEILNDKSTLTVRMLDRSNWVKHDCRPNCFYCDHKFRPFSLKRHCRGCGEIVCTSCYRRRKVRSGHNEPAASVPLCFDCIDKAMISAEHHAGKVCDDTILGNQGRANGDSVKTTSTGESFCSRASELSGASASDSDFDDDSASNTTADEHAPTMHRGPSHQIEFMSEKDQFAIYEARRRELIKQYGIKNPGNEKEYEALCELVSRALDTTVAAVGFIEDRHQWYKARMGISQSELPREVAFCSQLLQTPLPTIILDVSKDPRFCNNPLVTGTAHIRFYATSPICDPETGIIIGSVFVMDPKPKKKMPQRAVEILSYVATAAEQLLCDSNRRRETMKIKRHSSPSMSMRSSITSHLSDMRPGSLMSVPEEIDGPEFHLHSSSSSVSSAPSSRESSKSDSRSRRHSQASHPQLQLLDPKLVLSSSTGSIKKKPTEPQRRNTAAGALETPSTAPPVEAKPTELARRDSGSQEVAAAPMQGLDKSCFELFYRITTTQQMLVQQQSTLLATLNQHATRIGSIEKTVDRIEGMVMSIQRTYSSPDLLLEGP